MNTLAFRFDYDIIKLNLMQKLSNLIYAKI